MHHVLLLPFLPCRLFSINLLPKGIINGIANKYQQEKWQYDGYKEQHKGELGARAHLARRGHGSDVLVCMCWFVVGMTWRVQGIHFFSDVTGPSCWAGCKKNRLRQRLKLRNVGLDLGNVGLDGNNVGLNGNNVGHVRLARRHVGDRSRDGNELLLQRREEGLDLSDGRL